MQTSQGQYGERMKHAALVIAEEKREARWKESRKPGQKLKE